MSSTEPAPHDPPEGAVRVAISGHFFEAPWTNIFWVFVTPHTDFDLPDLTLLANAMLTGWSNDVVSQTSEGNVSEVCKGVAWDADGPHDFVSDIEGGRGVRTDNAIAAGTAALVNWRTDSHYRGGHPRSYVCGLTQDQLETTTLLTDAAVADYSDGAMAFLTEVNTIGVGSIDTVRLGSVAFWRAHVALNPPLFFPYFSGSCRRTLASQRRRQEHTAP